MTEIFLIRSKETGKWLGPDGWDDLPTTPYMYTEGPTLLPV